MNYGPKSNWKRFLLGTAAGGFLLVAQGALADVPKPTASVQGDFSEAGRLIADAQKAAKSGNIRLALINLKKAIQIAPSNNDAHMQLGIVLFQAGDQAGGEREIRLARKGGAAEGTALPILLKMMLARLEYQQVLDEFPDPGTNVTPMTMNILKARAFALQRVGRGPEAVDAADRALKLQRDGQSLLARASLALQQKDFKAANQFADEAFRAAPQNSEIAIFRLGVMKASNDDVGAMAFSDLMLTKFPGNLNVQYVHIEQLLDRKLYTKAKAEIDALLAKNPSLKMPVYYKALLASRMGDTRTALDLALTLPQEFIETSSDVGLAVAQMALDAGRRNAAVDILLRALKKDPDSLAVRLKLASLYLNQRDAKTALGILSPVKDSSDPQTVRVLSQLYTVLKRKDEALAVLKRLGSTSDHAFLELQAGRTDEAIAEMKEVAAKEPGNIAVIQPLIRALINDHRFGDALAVADGIGRDPALRAASLVFRGEVLLAQQNLPDARTAFDRAVGLDPKNLAVRLARASFLSAIMKYDDAVKDLRAVLSSDGKNVAARLSLAEIAMRQGNDPEARKMLGEAMALAPQDASPRLAQIGYLITRKDLKGALKTADELVRLQPASAEGLTLRGQVQTLLGQKDEAVDSFRRLVAVAPNAAQSQMLLGDALFAAGDRAGAMAALDAAAELNPQSPLVKNAQINLQFAFGNTDTAVTQAMDFQTSYPGPEADILAADTLTRAKRLGQASDLLTKSLTAKPDASVMTRLVRVKIAMGDKKAARDLRAEWLSRNPNDLTVRRDFAEFLLGENDLAGARSQYESILRQDAGNALAMNNLGWLLQTSDPQRALSLMTRASQLAPNSPEVADTLGWFKLQQKKDMAGSLALLQRAHDLKPQDAQITYHLVVALDANAKRDAARGLLKTLLASGAKFQEQPDAVRLASAWR